MTPEQRRQQFINGIVEVCKRHRVMLDVDRCYGWREPVFVEQTRDGDGFQFLVELEDIETLLVKIAEERNQD